MSTIRYTLGFSLAVLCGGIATLCHYGLHLAAWLMDVELEMGECPTCKGE